MFGFEIPEVEPMMAMLLDVSIKATLLTVAVWATMALFRVRSVTIKHRVWSLVLFNMLLFPAVIPMAPAVVVPVWWSISPVAATFPDRPADVQAGEIPSISPVADMPHDPNTVSDQETNLAASVSSAETITENAATQPVNVAVPVVPPVNPVVPNTVAPVRRMSFLFAIALIYTVGVTVLLARILLGMIQCSRLLIHQTRPVVFPNDLQLPTTTARITESDEVLVPLTLGLWHPVIVLPTDWKKWDRSLLEAAIAHEAEHVRRRDTWVAMITTFNTALYWFHPLSWLLRRHITELAEQACDDEVIRTTGQRTAYAQILVEMAARLATGSRRYEPAGIGMAKTPLVELRVTRILDSNRPLADRLSILFSAVLISIMAAAATITAGLSSAPAVAETQELKIAPTPAQPAVADPVNGNQIDDPQFIEGRVVMADDSPVADAEVRMLTWAGTTRYKTATTKTNDRGEFRFDEFGDGKHRIAAYVYDQDLASRIERYKGNVAEPGSKPVVLKLEKVPALKVTAKAADSGLPIADARVRLTSTDIERDYPTDAKGEVTIHGLTPEAWTIEVQAKGFAEQVHTVKLTGSVTAEITATLEPGAELSGIVRNEAGEVLPDAGVSVFPSGFRGEQIEYMKTNAEGEYRFEYMPIQGVLLLVSKDDYQSLRQDVVISVAAGESQKQDLTLVRREDGGSIQGTVVDFAGSPVSGATVGNYGGSSSDVRETTTNVDGAFQLDNVFRRYDGYRLTVRAKGYAPQQLSFEPGTHVRPGKIAIRLEPGHAVSGKVVNEKGEPLSDVWIAADGPPGTDLELAQHTTSDVNGHFSFDSLSDGMPLDFRKSGYSPIEDERVPLDGKDEVIVILPDEGVLRGKVVDSETGNPISPVIVHIAHSPDRTPNDPSGSLSGPSVSGGETFVEPDGTFRLGDLMRGMPLQVTVEAANYERKVERRIVATAEKDGSMVEFRLVRVDESAFFPVGGQLLNEASKPVPNAELRLIVTSQKRPFPREDFPFNWEMIKSGQTRETDVVSQFLSATTDAEGRFEFSQVRPGKDIELLWWGPGISQARLDGIEDQKPEQRAKLSIQTVTAGIVLGVIDPTMFPEVSIVDLVNKPNDRGNFHSHRSPPLAADGSYEVRDVPPGTYELMIYGSFTREADGSLSNAVIKRIPVTVESGKTVTLDIGRENSKSVAPDKEPKPATSATPVKPRTDATAKAEDRPLDSESEKDKTIQRWPGLRNFNIQISDIRRLDPGSKVRTVLLRGPRISDSDLQRLAEFPEIEEIGFLNTSIDGSGLQHLAALPRLTELAFLGEQCTDVVLEAIPELPQVRSLTLMGCGTSDRALKILARFPQLRTLQLRFVRADQGLENLQHVPLLTDLNLGDTHLTDSGLQHLASVPHLKQLTLDGPSDISDDGMSVLQHLPELESFYCTGLVVHGEGLKNLAAATNLKTLSFVGPGVNDEWLRAVTSLQNVEWIQCHRSEITGSGLKWIENWSKVKQAWLNYNRIDDAGIEYLAKLYRLEHLDVIHNRLSDVGLKSLREALPDTFIQDRESPATK